MHYKLVLGLLAYAILAVPLLVAIVVLLNQAEPKCGNHWNYPNTGLLEQDKEILQQSPYFNTTR